MDDNEILARLDTLESGLREHYKALSGGGRLSFTRDAKIKQALDAIQGKRFGITSAGPRARAASFGGPTLTATPDPTTTELGKAKVTWDERGNEGVPGALTSLVSADTYRSEPGTPRSMVNRFVRGYTTDFVGNAGRAVATLMPLGPMPGTGRIAPLADNPFWKAGEASSAFGEQALPVKAEDDEKILTGMLPSLLGQLLPMMATGPVGAAAQGVALESGSMAKDAKQHGASDATTRLAALGGVPIGLLDAVLPGRFFGGVAGKTGRVLRGLSSGAVEGGTEALQGGGEDVVAKALYDPNRPMGVKDILARQAPQGGAGGIAGAAFGLLTPGRPRINPNLGGGDKTLANAAARAEAIKLGTAKAQELEQQQNEAVRTGAAADEKAYQDARAALAEAPEPTLKKLIAPESNAPRPLFNAVTDILMERKQLADQELVVKAQNDALNAAVGNARKRAGKDPEALFGDLLAAKLKVQNGETSPENAAFLESVMQSPLASGVTIGQWFESRAQAASARPAPQAPFQPPADLVATTQDEETALAPPAEQPTPVYRPQPAQGPIELPAGQAEPEAVYRPQPAREPTTRELVSNLVDSLAGRGVTFGKGEQASQPGKPARKLVDAIRMAEQERVKSQPQQAQQVTKPAPAAAQGGLFQAAGPVASPAGGRQAPQVAGYRVDLPDGTSVPVGTLSEARAVDSAWRKRAPDTQRNTRIRLGTGEILHDGRSVVRSPEGRLVARVSLGGALVDSNDAPIQQDEVISAPLSRFTERAAAPSAPTGAATEVVPFPKKTAGPAETVGRPVPEASPRTTLPPTLSAAAEAPASLPPEAKRVAAPPPSPSSQVAPQPAVEQPSPQETERGEVRLEGIREKARPGDEGRDSAGVGAVPQRDSRGVGGKATPTRRRWREHLDATPLAAGVPRPPPDAVGTRQGFHGTLKPLDGGRLDIGRAEPSAVAGPGVYVSSSRERGGHYYRRGGEKGSLLSLDVTLQRPLVLRHDVEMPLSEQAALGVTPIEGADGAIVLLGLRRAFPDGNVRRDHILSLGYDGMVYSVDADPDAVVSVAYFDEQIGEHRVVEGVGAAPTVPATPGVRSEPISNLHLDPRRFQFKTGGTEAGVTQNLGARKFDTNLSGVIAVWRDPADGKLYVVNGHHRFDLAQRSGVESMDVKEIDAPSAEVARLTGALINIAEGRGTDIDVAKVFRDGHFTREDLDERGMPMTEAKVKNGLVLAGLDDALFGFVAQGHVSVGDALAIGESLQNHAQQFQLWKEIESERRKGRTITQATIRELAREVAEAGTETVEQTNLFGTQTVEESLAFERADIRAYIRERLSKERRAFEAVSAKGRADVLESAGNKIERDVNEARAGAATEALALFDKMTGMSGPHQEVLRDAARRLKSGEPAATVKQDAYSKYLQALRDLSGRSPESTGPGDGGREGGPGDEGPSLFPERASPLGRPGSPIFNEAEIAELRGLAQEITGRSADEIAFVRELTAALVPGEQEALAAHGLAGAKPLAGLFGRAGAPIIQVSTAQDLGSIRRATLHEAFHDVFNTLATDAERQALYDHYGPKVPRNGLQAKEQRHVALEEKAADDFARYAANRTVEGLPKGVAGLFERIKQFLARLGDVLRKVFKRHGVDSPQAFFDKILSGEVAKRRDVTDFARPVGPRMAVIGEIPSIGETATLSIGKQGTRRVIVDDVSDAKVFYRRWSESKQEWAEESRSHDAFRRAMRPDVSGPTVDVPKGTGNEDVARILAEYGLTPQSVNPHVMAPVPSGGQPVGVRGRPSANVGGPVETQSPENWGAMHHAVSRFGPAGQTIADFGWNAAEKHAPALEARALTGDTGLKAAITKAGKLFRRVEGKELRYLVERTDFDRNIAETEGRLRSVTDADERSFLEDQIAEWKRAKAALGYSLGDGLTPELEGVVAAHRLWDDQTYDTFRQHAGAAAAGKVQDHFPRQFKPEVIRDYEKRGPIFQRDHRRLAKRILEAAANPKGAQPYLRVLAAEATRGHAESDWPRRAHEVAGAALIGSFDPRNPFRHITRKMGHFELHRSDFFGDAHYANDMVGLSEYYHEAAFNIQKWLVFGRISDTEVDAKSGLPRVLQTPEDGQNLALDMILNDPDGGPDAQALAGEYLQVLQDTVPETATDKSFRRWAATFVGLQHVTKLARVKFVAQNIMQWVGLGSHLGVMSVPRALYMNVVHASERAENVKAGAIPSTRDSMHGGSVREVIDSRYAAHRMVRWLSDTVVGPIAGKLGEIPNNSFQGTRAHAHAQYLVDVLRHAGWRESKALRAVERFWSFNESSPSNARRRLKELYGWSESQINEAIRVGHIDSVVDDMVPPMADGPYTLGHAARAAGARDVNFRPGPQFTPSVLAHRGIVGTLGWNFKNFSFNMMRKEWSRVFKEAAVHRNFAPLVGTFVGFNLGGELLWLFEDWFYDRERKSKYADTVTGHILGRLYENVGLMGSLGLLERPMDLADPGAILGPTGRTAANVITFAMNRGRRLNMDNYLGAAWHDAKKIVFQEVAGWREAVILYEGSKLNVETFRKGEQAARIYTQATSSKNVFEKAYEKDRRFDVALMEPERDAVVKAIYLNDPIKAKEAVRTYLSVHFNASKKIDESGAPLGEDEKLKEAVDSLKDALVAKSPLQAVSRSMKEPTREGNVRIERFAAWAETRRPKAEVEQVLAAHRYYVDAVRTALDPYSQGTESLDVDESDETPQTVAGSQRQRTAYPAAR